MSGTGWQSAFNQQLPASGAELETRVLDPICDQFASFTALDETVPMNCVSWFEAQAFCIWDGGRLPSDLEFNFAAAGGLPYRILPWGGDTPTNNEAAFECRGTDDVMGGCVPADLQPVGSRPPGKGKFGQHDLAGDVKEWTFDFFNGYVSPCDDCVQLTPGPAGPPIRMLRGGAFNDVQAHPFTTFREGFDPANRNASIGFRCVRVP